MTNFSKRQRRRRSVRFRDLEAKYGEGGTFYEEVVPKNNSSKVGELKTLQTDQRNPEQQG